MRLLYTALLYGLLPLALLRLYWRGRRDPDHRQRWRERFGWIAPLPEPACEATPLDGVDVLTAPAAGVLVYRKALGDRVSAGEAVADLVSLLGEPIGASRTPLRTVTDGLLLARAIERLVRPGQKFCKIAGQEPLSYRKTGQLLED